MDPSTKFGRLTEEEKHASTELLAIALQAEREKVVRVERERDVAVKIRDEESRRATALLVELDAVRRELEAARAELDIRQSLTTTTTEPADKPAVKLCGGCLHWDHEVANEGVRMCSGGHWTHNVFICDRPAEYRPAGGEGGSDG